MNSKLVLLLLANVILWGTSLLPWWEIGYCTGISEIGDYVLGRLHFSDDVEMSAYLYLWTLGYGKSGSFIPLHPAFLLSGAIIYIFSLGNLFLISALLLYFLSVLLGLISMISKRKRVVLTALVLSIMTLFTYFVGINYITSMLCAINQEDYVSFLPLWGLVTSQSGENVGYTRFSYGFFLTMFSIILHAFAVSEKT